MQGMNLGVCSSSDAGHHTQPFAARQLVGRKLPTQLAASSAHISSRHFSHATRDLVPNMRERDLHNTITVAIGCHLDQAKQIVA